MVKKQGWFGRLRGFINSVRFIGGGHTIDEWTKFFDPPVNPDPNAKFYEWKIMKYNKYHITYFYLATGMEGIPDTDDFGIVLAENEDEAKNIIIEIESTKALNNRGSKWSDSDKSWYKSCLSAKLVSNDKKEENKEES